MQVLIPAADWSEVCALMAARNERAAFLFGEVNGEQISVSHTWLLNSSDAYAVSSPYTLELADHVRPEVIRRAHEAGSAVIEIHSHGAPGLNTQFSNYDLLGLEDYARHMLWRLPGLPYVSLVWGPDSIDGLWWSTLGQPPLVLDALVVSDKEPMRPTGLSLPHYLELHND